MYRRAIEELKSWKKNKHRKPLIIQGARQVGKTWLMQEFGRTEYENTVYLNFDKDKRLSKFFEGDINPEKIISAIELLYEQNISTNPESTLIIFDEVQEIPRALTSLKYFCEQAPKYSVVCAGSLLGIALHSGTSFPVGKVDFLDLYPLTFDEFLLACGAVKLVELLKAGDWDMVSVVREKYIEYLRTYYVVGGMPEAVQAYVDTRDFKQVRRIQNNILNAYEQDFSKHAPANIVPRIRTVWENVPSQLARENKKFVYGLLRSGARAKDYELAIMWLCDCGLTHKIGRVSAIRKPLISYQNLKAFKLFFVDVGLLARHSGVSEKTILEGDTLFVEFKGALTEQFVCQQLCARDDASVFYYTNEKNTCEVDFVAQIDGEAIPIEVKAETNLKAKSLRSACQKFGIENALRFSMSDYKDDGWVANYPLYGVNFALD